MENKTNFDEIRRVALRLAETENIPEITKDFLVNLVASETSLVHTMQGFTALTILCPAFSMVIDKTMVTALSQYIRIAIDGKGKL